VGRVAELPSPQIANDFPHRISMIIEIPHHMSFGYWVLVCFAVTQLGTQLQQRCIQVVCSKKQAWKRQTESSGTPAMDLGHMNVVLK